MKKPLIAGGAAALALALAIGALAVSGGGEPPRIGARADIEPAADQNRPTEDAPEDTVMVQIPDTAIFSDQDEASLPGVGDGEALGGEVQPPPNSNAARRQRMANLRNAALTEDRADGGVLPVIGPDGARASQAYARGFETSGNDAPVIAVVVGGLGVSETLTEQAIETLPAEITLSFVPYARDLQDWIDRARLAGHEVLIELPMEPYDYPDNDPGPHTLLVEAGERENARRLEWLLSRAQGYFGVTNYLGARLTADQGAMTPILEALEARGLAVFHDGAGRRSGLQSASDTSGVPVVMADRIVDNDPSPAEISDQLLELEAIALSDGHALGSAFAYPATLDTLADWAEDAREQGYALAPASHVARLRAGGAESPDSGT